MTLPTAAESAQPGAVETNKTRGVFTIVNASGTFLGLGVVAHLLFLLSLRFGWLNPLFNDTCHRFGPGGDFFSIYAAGVKARAGESIYTIGGHVEAVKAARKIICLLACTIRRSVLQ